MRIFIAGCARSGTTLTADLMSSFNDLFVLRMETEVETFEKIRRVETNVVLKRTATSYIRLPALPADIGLIYCVRHPFDTLTSSHPETKRLRPFHVTPQRRRDEYTGLMTLRARQPERQIFFSRYEDLIGEPDRVQDRMAEFFRLRPRRRFSDDPANPIFATSIEKWKRNGDLLSYLYGLPMDFLSLVIRFAAEFNYELPNAL